MLCTTTTTTTTTVITACSEENQRFGIVDRDIEKEEIATILLSPIFSSFFFPSAIACILSLPLILKS